MIDSHTHLDACEPPDAELVAAATAAGVRADPDRRHRPGELPRGARARPSASRRCTRRSAATRTTPSSLDDELLRELAAHPRCAAIGETGLDYYRDRAPRELQQRAFEAQIELAREIGKPLVIHTRAAAEDTLALLERRAGGPRGDPPLLLDARAPRPLRRRPAGGSRSPATSPTRRPRELRRRRRARPRRAAARRDRRAVPRAAVAARPAQRAGRGRRDGAVPRRAARASRRPSSRRRSSATPPRCSAGERGHASRACGGSPSSACARAATSDRTS